MARTVVSPLQRVVFEKRDVPSLHLGAFACGLPRTVPHLLKPAEGELMLTCLRRDHAALPVGEYLAVNHHHELPPEICEDDRIVRHGYAAEVAGVWYFFGDLEPAIAFGRAARMSLNVRAYGVFRAAHETRHCPRHGDERVLVFVGLQLDRGADEPGIIARFAAGVARHPESSHWHASIAQPSGDDSVGERTAVSASRKFSEGLVGLFLALDPDPIRWYENRWRSEAVKKRTRSQAGEVFTPAGLRELGDHLRAIADHLRESGGTL